MRWDSSAFSLFLLFFCFFCFLLSCLICLFIVFSFFLICLSLFPLFLTLLFHKLWLVHFGHFWKIDILHCIFDLRLGIVDEIRFLGLLHLFPFLSCLLRFTFTSFSTFYHFCLLPFPM